MALTQVPVSVRAVEARVRRALAKQEAILKKCKADSRWFRDLGEYYTVDFNNRITGSHINLEELARELGVLRSGEAMPE